MPRKRKLPPNLQWEPGRKNIYIQFEVDGCRHHGSTGTDDVLNAQDFLDRKVEEAYRDIRLGIKEKIDLRFSEAFEIAWAVRLWDTLDDKGQQRERNHRNQIIEAMGDFYLSSIDDGFTNTYLRRRQAVAAERGRKPFAKISINNELAKIQRVLLALDPKRYALPEKKQRQSGGHPTFPISMLPITKAERERNTTLDNIDECIVLMDAMVPHARPIVLTATLTSLRKSSVHNLDVQNVDLLNDIITVVQKGGTRHSVPIHNDLRPALVELIGNRKRGPLFVFGQNGCECSRCVEFTKQRVVGEIRPGTPSASEALRLARSSKTRPTRCGRCARRVTTA